MNDAARSAFYQYLQSGEAEGNPLLGAIMAHEGNEMLQTTAYEVEPEPGWHRLSVADYMTEARVEFNCLTHAAHLRSGRRDVLTLHRHLRGRDWSEREQMLASMLFQMILPHLGTTLRPVGEPSILDLPLRALGVLDGFFRGLSSKEVAAERGISVHTVREYTKVINQHFNVQSRGELQALFAGVSHRHQIRPLFEA